VDGNLHVSYWHPLTLLAARVDDVVIDRVHPVAVVLLLFGSLST